MESALDKMFKDFQKSIPEEFFDRLYYVRVSQVKVCWSICWSEKKEVKYLVVGKMKCLGLYKNVAEIIYQNYCRNYPEITYNYFLYFKLVIVHFRVEEISCYFFRPHFYKIFKAKKNNGTEMSFLKYESRNEMLIYCFACRDFIRSFFW